jgi:hypothetical protein
VDAADGSGSPRTVSFNTGARRWRRSTPGATVGGSNQRKKRKERGLGWHLRRKWEGGGGRLRGAVWREGECGCGLAAARHEAGGGGRWAARRGSAYEGRGRRGLLFCWAVAVGQPKGIATFCFIQIHFSTELT